MNIFRMYHSVLQNEEQFIGIVDLVFDGKQPVAVLAWEGKGRYRRPKVRINLDAARLIQHDDADADYLYDGYIVDPRGVH